MHRRNEGQHTEEPHKYRDPHHFRAIPARERPRNSEFQTARNERPGDRPITRRGELVAAKASPWAVLGL
jgi:hypothetical protein